MADRGQQRSAEGQAARGKRKTAEDQAARCGSPAGREGLHSLLKLRQLLHCPEQVARLRQNRVLKNRLISDESVRSGYALHRSIEVMKELIGDSRCDLRAVSPAERVFVSDQRAIGLLHRSCNRVPVKRI